MGPNSNKRQQVGRRHVKAKEGIESQVLVFLPPLAALFRLRRAKHVSYMRQVLVMNLRHKARKTGKVSATSSDVILQITPVA